MGHSRTTLLVTGGSRGIGRAVCLLAARRGHDICFSYRSDEAAAESLAEEIRGLGRRVLPVRADMADPDAVHGLFETLDREFDGLDALVNNAGTIGGRGTFMDTPPETVRQVFEVNVFGLMECSRLAVARMSRTRGRGRGGSIVNLTSGAAHTGAPNAYVWYGASKAAVESFTVGLAREVVGEGIRVNAVSPGVTNTAIHETGGAANAMEAMVRTTPMGRAAEPMEIAEPILWLLSDAASYVTGTVLRASGGR